MNTGLQYFINSSSAITLNTPRVGGHQVTRSGRVRVGSQASQIPWQMSVTPAQVFPYNQDFRAAWALLQSRHLAWNPAQAADHTITLGDNPGLHWITAYQGDLTPGQLGDIQWLPGASITQTWDISGVTGLNTGDLVVAGGDLVQAPGNAYPHRVVEDVRVPAVGSEVTVTLHRPWIPGGSIQTGVTVGPGVSWQVTVIQMPQIQLIPGHLVELTGAIQLMEIVT